LTEIYRTSRRRLASWWAWLVIATMAAAAIISLRYVAVAVPVDSAADFSARLLTITGQLATLVTFLLLPVLLLALLLPRPRFILALGVAVSSLILVFMLADSQVFQLYRFHLNAGVLALLSAGAETQVLRLPWISYLQALGIALAAIAWQGAVAVWIWRRLGVVPHPWLRGRVGAVFFCGLIVAYQLTHVWADAVGFTPITRDTSLLPFAYPVRARGMMRNLGFEVNREQWRMQADGGGLSYPLQPVHCEPPAPRRNIVFILIDSWRFDAEDARISAAATRPARARSASSTASPRPIGTTCFSSVGARSSFRA
jgi:membrane-anchored protein YejM (alkaline phosphatase superfamily)